MSNEKLARIGFSDKELTGFFRIANRDAARAMDLLSASQYKLWHYLLMIDTYADKTRNGEPIYHKLPSPADIALKVGSSVRRVEMNLRVLDSLGFIPDSFDYSSRKNNSLETVVVKSLVAREFPTAITEFYCPIGRIDILTKTQIIEVKRIAGWKAAMGQILVYSAYYPEHQKRIHLFGSEADKEKLLDIELSCSAFDVLVTFASQRAHAAKAFVGVSPSGATDEVEAIGGAE